MPDEKTIRLFRKQLTEAGLIEPFFQDFEAFLHKNGFSAREGQSIDSSFVEASRKRNSRGENKQIKEGESPEDWSEQKKRPKDKDARLAQKNGQNYYGYKNHINVTGSIN